MGNLKESWFYTNYFFKLALPKVQNSLALALEGGGGGRNVAPW